MTQQYKEQTTWMGLRWKKSYIKSCLLFGSIYMTLWKRQSYRHNTGHSWPGAEGVGRRSGLVLDLDYISASSGGMSLYSGSWIGLLRYQLTHLQVDSGNVRYRRYAPFPSIQALPISSNNNDFHGFNALKFHNNPLHRFCYDHRMPKKPRWYNLPKLYRERWYNLPKLYR